MDWLKQNKFTSATYDAVSNWSTATKVSVGTVTGIIALYKGYKYLFPPRLHDSYFEIKNELISNLKYVGKHSSKIELNDFPNVVKEMKLCFRSNITRRISNRKKELKNLIRLLKENRDSIVAALSEDLGRHELLSLFETGTQEYRSFLQNVDEWAAPQPLGFSMATFPASDYLIPEPYGTVYVNGIWNFPFSTSLHVIAGAIVAGNNVVFKPCNTAPKSSALLCDLLDKYMDSRFVQCIGHPTIANGDDRVTTAKILENEFDLIFFTGSTNGGKYIMQQAAKFLTPVVLELGGKNPVIIDDTADLGRAARTIVSYRILNSGQICMCPDYVLIYKNVVDKFIDECKKYASKWYKMGKDLGSDCCKNQCKFVSQQQYQRCIDLLNSTKGKVVFGGGSDEKLRMMEPTIVLLDNIKNIANEPTIKQETFGPILWIVPINNDVKEAVDFINNNQEKSLTMSLFSNNTKNQNVVKYNTSSGGLQINGHAQYTSHEKAPFGGIGKSGIGAYHGKYSFDTFSHMKPVGKSYAENKMAYPPYTDPWKEWMIKKMIS